MMLAIRAREKRPLATLSPSLNVNFPGDPRPTHVTRKWGHVFGGYVTLQHPPNVFCRLRSRETYGARSFLSGACPPP